MDLSLLKDISTRLNLVNMLYRECFTTYSKSKSVYLQVRRFIFKIDFLTQLLTKGIQTKNSKNKNKKALQNNFLSLSINVWEFEQI